jgi:hypothetical protein
MEINKFADVIHEMYKEVEKVLQEDLLLSLDNENLAILYLIEQFLITLATINQDMEF